MTTVDRTGWPPGPWDGEPDRLEWRHEGLPCLITRNASLGYLCGYVAVPPGHRLYETHHPAGLEAHGSVNYSAHCAGHICHVPEPGEPGDVWWFGFDCMHAFDAAPGMIRYAAALASAEHYRDLAYVRAEVEALAEQLSEQAL